MVYENCRLSKPERLPPLSIKANAFGVESIEKF
jgi:hypothetical protein